MLSFNTNYGQLSNNIFTGGLNDRDILLEDPDQVAEDGEMAFTSAFWYYMFPQSPKPSMHDALLGFFEPNAEDQEANICTGCFGTTINLINEGECGTSTPTATARSDSFLDFCDEFDADCPETDIGCEDMGSFPS